MRRTSIAAGVSLCLLLAGAVRAQEATVAVIDSPEKAKAAQAAWAARLGKPVQWTNSIGMKFQLIPPGEFVMGGRISADDPPHTVRITQPFYLGTTEVTRAQWEKVTETVRTTFFPGPEIPIHNVDTRAIATFMARLNKAETAAYRLPTEAEWEFAARAGASVFDIDAVAWYNRNSDNVLHPVAQKAPNAFGLFDMLGNAYEWCEDLYDADYYANSPVEDPKGPAKSLYGYRVLRGGSIYSGPALCTPQARNYYQASRYEKYIGFRVALPIPTEPPAPKK